jgi:hypothetical protein
MQKKVKTKSKPVKKKPVKKKIEAELLPHVENSKTEYQNCVVYKIENATFGMPMGMQMLPGQAPSQTGVLPDDNAVEQLQKKMIDHISVVTGFSTELVERVIQEANEFMDRNFGNGPE